MPDTPEHAFTEAGKTLAAELYKSDPWGPAAVAAVEKQAAQRAIDALTAAHKECVEQCCRCCPALSEEPHDA
jgi:hypothetical protein